MRVVLGFVLGVFGLSSAGFAAEATRLEKLQAVLAHLGAADSADYGSAIGRLENVQTRKGFETILKYTDQDGALRPYLAWDEDKLRVYLDRDTRQLLDYEVPFKASAPSDPEGLVAALRQAALNPANQPLNGLRIALDPGHMGGPDWDRRTGKYVKTAHGYVSEAEIALDSCLLLMRELLALGADVMITKKAAGPVWDQPLEKFNLAPFVASELRASTDAPWFEQLLASAPLGPKLLANADQNHEIRKMRGEDMRETYFITRGDLAARAEKINAFRPHLTLVVHFDAAKVDEIQNNSSTVRGYVAGYLMAGETASREQRFNAVRNLLDGRRWMESSVFTAAVVKGISLETGTKIRDVAEDFKARRIVDGVYARNLALTRQVNRGAMAYVEVLNYDYAPEFNRLKIKNRTAEIDGVKFNYPARIDAIVAGLKRGILDYVRSMAPTATAPNP